MSKRKKYDQFSTREILISTYTALIETAKKRSRLEWKKLPKKSKERNQAADGLIELRRRLKGAQELSNE